VPARAGARNPRGDAGGGAAAGETWRLANFSDTIHRGGVGLRAWSPEGRFAKLDGLCRAFWGTTGAVFGIDELFARVNAEAHPDADHPAEASEKISERMRNLWRRNAFHAREARSGSLLGAGPGVRRPSPSRCSQEDVVMRTYDFAPLYRSTVGFDRLFSMLDQAARVEPSTQWPPYDIEKVADDAYRITMAVAGFSQDEIELTQHDTTLLVTGQKKDKDGEREYLHRGIAARAFRQSFSLADHVKVTGASLENGLLAVDLKREVPEALKPRRIAIGGTRTAIGQDNALAQVENRVAEDRVRAA
jgi:molecular chaperone IbpA